MNALTAPTIPPYWQDRLGRRLMAFACVGALAAFASAMIGVAAASSDVVWMETWRAFGFFVFAGMFALVALRPRLSAGIWELAFLHKLAMAISAFFLSGAREVGPAGTVDAILAALIAVAYGCTRGWTSWKLREIR